MMLPFVRRHIELADPDVIVLMGNHACQGLLGRRGITRLRGQVGRRRWAGPRCRCSTPPTCCGHRAPSARPGRIF